MDFDRPFAMPFPWVEGLLHLVVGVVDLVAVAILLVGAGRFIYWMTLGEVASRSGEQRLERQNLARIELGRYILAGLELLIVADVIRTAMSFELAGLVFLAGLVIVRSAISWFLDREIATIEHRRTHDAPE